MAKTAKCPFSNKDNPCPAPDVYDGPTPQKQGTAVCPLHGRFVANEDVKAEAEESLAEGATAPVAPSPGQETGTGKVTH